VDEADRILAAYRQLAGELVQPTLQWVAAWMHAGRLLLAGQADEAENLARQALEIAQDTGQPDALSFFAVQIFWIAYDRGRLDETESLVLDNLHAYPAISSWRPMLTVICSEGGRVAEASRLLRSLAADGFDFPFDVVWGHSVAECAISCADLADAESAAVLYPAIAPYTGQWCFPAGGMASGAMDHYVGLLAATLGRFDEAAGHFAAAAAIHEGVGAPGWLARTRLEWARLLLTRRHPGDADTARDLLGQALATARELGLGGIERHAAALVQRLAH
jgi:tetratricopeptide (TPR) repeat protein